MRRLLFLICAMNGCLMATSAFAQFGNAGFGNPAVQPPVAIEDSRPIQLDITLIDIAGEDASKNKLTDEQQLSRLERLKSEGKLAGVQRLRMNLLSNQSSQLQQGETVQVPVGRTRAGSPDQIGGRGGFGGQASMQEITQARQVGTMLSAIAKAVPGGAIVDLKLERSGLTMSRQPEAADAPPPEPPKTRQLTTNTTVMLREAETKIVGMFQSARGESQREETWVLARVAVAPPEKTPAVSSIRIFHLKNSSAKDTVEVIASIFESKHVRAVADVRTNTVIVVSAPDDEMQQIEAILMKLDEGVAAAAPPTTTRLVPIPANDAPLFNPAPSRKPTPVPPGREPLDDLNPRSR